MIELGDNPSLSLYIHLPFCKRCCSYCAFYSEEQSQWKEYRDGYVQRLVKEVEKSRESYGRDFSTIFLGGGNPLCLTELQLETILIAAGNSSETTIEMNPESFTEMYFPLFEKRLANRLSMGIQSLQPRFLTTLGRNSTREENLEGIALASKLRKRCGVSVNFDLMTCIPGQDVSHAICDIDELLSLSDFDHLSLYCLTVEEGTVLAGKLKEGLLEVPDEDMQSKMLFSLWEHLERKGLVHYEVSNFARPGKQCRHNLRYWQLEPYLGLGSSAASRIFQGGDWVGLRNDQSLASYESSPLFSGYSKEILSRKEELEEYLLVTLRTRSGLDKETFRKRFSLDFDTIFGKALEGMGESLFVDTRGRFSLTEKGLMIMDSLVLRLASCI